MPSLNKKLVKHGKQNCFNLLTAVNLWPCFVNKIVKILQHINIMCQYFFKTDWRSYLVVHLVVTSVLNFWWLPWGLSQDGSLPPAYAVEVMFSSCVWCVCVCLSDWTITFEPVDIETSFLVWWYILTMSRSSLSIKGIGSRSSHEKC